MVVVLIMVQCLLYCMQWMIDESTNGIFLLQRERGDVVNGKTETARDTEGIVLQPWKKLGLM